MRRTVSLVSGVVWLAGAATATAQVGPAARPAASAPTASQAQGLRTLSWPGKAARPDAAATPAPVVARQTSSPPVGVAPSPAPAVSTETRYSPGAAPRTNGLTPASAFYAAPASPAYVARVAPDAAPPPPPPTAPAPADMMAPRADAPIYSVRAEAPPSAAPTPAASVPPASAPAPQATGGASAPGSQGARYYSVHRAAGRAPDATPLPAPFFLDVAPVDLAEPPAPPAQVRRNGLNPNVADGSDLP